MVALVALFFDNYCLSLSHLILKGRLVAKESQQNKMSYQSIEIGAGNIIEGLCQPNVLVSLHGGAHGRV